MEETEAEFKATYKEMEGEGRGGEEREGREGEVGRGREGKRRVR